MSIAVQLPTRPLLKHKLLSYALSVILILMLVSQLYSYDELTLAFTVLLPAGVSSEIVTLLPAVVVILELVALCYALPLYLSKLARYISLVAIVIVPIVWIILLISPLLRAQSGVYPILGTKVPLPIDAISGIVVLILAIFAAAVVYYDFTHRRIS